LKHCCEAYLNARKELGILLTLQHPHIVPLIGISLQPLSLLLSLAPSGALSERLKEFFRAGAQLTPECIAEILLQVSLALFSLPLITDDFPFPGGICIGVLACQPNHLQRSEVRKRFGVESACST
jgi:hypothetical protein